MVSKKFARALALASIIAALAASAAQAFPLPTYVSYTPYAATVSVTNPYGVPVSCATQIQGFRNDGLTQFANIVIPFVGYGMTQYAYVNVIPPFYFVGAYGYADCGYLY